MQIRIAAITCLALGMCTSTFAADISGKWNIQGSIDGNEITAACTFTQTSDDLAGTCVRPEGPAKAAGKVDGQKVTWSYDIDYNGSPLTMKYDGTVDSGKITGTITVVQYGAGGDFTATQSTASGAAGAPTAAAPAISAPAAGNSTIDGQWTATIQTVMGPMDWGFTFKVDGNNLTGTATNKGDDSKEVAIEDGKIDGDTVTFTEPRPLGGAGDVKIQYTGKIVSSNEIKFTRVVGSFGSEDFSAKRVQ